MKEYKNDEGQVYTFNLFDLSVLNYYWWIRLKFKLV